MIFRTEVDIPKPTFSIEPLEQMLFVGSCFADNIGRRFADEKFRAVVNPYGVMYNPVSILHTVRRFAMPLQADSYDRLVCVFTLGTNHVYRLREPARLWTTARSVRNASFRKKNSPSTSVGMPSPRQ